MVSTSINSSVVHDWPLFRLWLLPWRSDPLSCFSLTWTLVLLRQMPPISLCRSVFISRVTIVKCTCSTWPTCEAQRSPFSVTKELIFVAVSSVQKLNPANSYCNTTITSSAKIKLREQYLLYVDINMGCCYNFFSFYKTCKLKKNFC